MPLLWLVEWDRQVCRNRCDQMPPSDFKTRKQIAELYPIKYSTLKKLGMKDNEQMAPPIIKMGKRAIYYHVPSFEKWFLGFMDFPPPTSTRRRRGRPRKSEEIKRQQ